MAKLLNMPEQIIVDGFKGTIDFYVNMGIPCARAWPTSPGKRRAPQVEAQWGAFRYASRLWDKLSPEVQAAYIHQAAGTRMSGRDLAQKAYIGGLYRYPTTPT